MAPLHEQIN